jgi:hypothetical protein
LHPAKGVSTAIIRLQTTHPIAIALASTDADSRANSFAYAIATLTFSGNYPTGGDTLDFTANLSKPLFMRSLKTGPLLPTAGLGQRTRGSNLAAGRNIFISPRHIFLSKH